MKRDQKIVIIVSAIALCLMIFSTGVGLILIDLYVEPRPVEERLLNGAAPPDVAMSARPLPTAAVAEAVTVPNESFLKSSRFGTTAASQKPQRMIGQILLGGEIQEPVPSYLGTAVVESPTPAAEVAMVTRLDTVSEPAVLPVPQRPTQTAAPPQPTATVPSTQPVEPTATAQPTETAVPPEPAASSTPIPSDGVYIVRYGDSLLSIATKLGVTKAILMEVNGLTEPAVIHPGDELQIPDITHLGVPHIGQIVWPVESRYIVKQYRYGHRAIDIVLPSGSPVVAIAAGSVEYAGWNQHGYGYMVLIDHGNNVHSLYAHNSAFHVKAGDLVEQGQLIADSGNTGNSTMPHLHLEIRASSQMLNPCLYLPDGC